MKWNRIIYRFASVPVTVLAIAFVYFFKIPNPMMILIIPVVLFTYLDGYTSGILSGSTAVIYSAYFFFIATSDVVAAEKLMTIVLAVSSIVIMVGKLKARDSRTIVQLKEAQEELVRKKDYAEEISHIKSEFLSRMSHEIRTPINAVFGMTAIGKKAESIEQKNQALNKIGEASSHLLGVINDVLDMAKIEADKLELAPVEYNFGQMLKKVFTVVGYQLDEKRQQLVVNVNENIPHYLIGDDQRLAQVITNLLANAVKFTPEDGEIRFDASIASESDGDCELCIEVTDSGIGISDEQKERLFSAYEQAESDISRKYGGTGLGLAISKRIIELMGGNIRIESELGKGARFIFTVKVRRGDTDPRTMPASGIDFVNEDSGVTDNIGSDTTVINEFAGKTMLLAEDIEINREILITLLGDTRLEIDCAENGKDALDMIGEHPNKYDIVFMDVQMPVMDGLEASRRIRQLPAHPQGKLPIIAMTANVFKSDIDKCLAAGMDGHLGKPLDMDKVLEVLRKYLMKE
ncbi:MAG: ATP-binding protein [Defluviitaleaceae bacterium]|nr:ATP-binding protein [Defluviitaleaceae bacterium]